MARAKSQPQPSPVVVTQLEDTAPSEIRRLMPPEASAALQALEDRLAPDVYRSSLSMVYEGQSKYVTWHLPETLGEVHLMQLTDVQFGHVRCKYERVEEYRDWILAEPNRFMLWTGDMIDAWAAWAPGSPFEQIGNPMSQVYRFAEFWAPARHRILGFVGGNHESRAIPAFGDLGALLAWLLRLPYSTGEQHLDIYFGQHKPFTVTLWHGRGSAQTLGGIAQMLERFSHRHDAQLAICGHLHRPMTIPLWKKQRNSKTRRMELQKRIVAIGSSFLDHWNSYGEVRGLSASDVLMTCAQLDANGHWQVSLR